MDKTLVLNKYGAIDVRIIADMQWNINQLEKKCSYLEKVIAKMAGVKFPEKIEGLKAMIEFDIDKRSKINKMIQDIPKMVELTHANDYEYQTTPSVTKLVKKGK